jgi:cysteinyl-tRNA synthetase
MTDFFGYDVHFVMNVTDIDDKVATLNFSPTLSIVSSPPSYPDHQPRASKPPP